METISAKEFLEYKAKEKPKESKYHNVFTEYNGRTYHSKKEAEYAAHLDLMVKANHVKKWEPQVKYVFTVNGIRVGTYNLDFKVWYSDGRIEHVDCKGDVNPLSVPYKLFKIKSALMLACFGITVIEK